MIDWIRGVFLYIEKIWKWIFDFFGNLMSWLADMLLGVLQEILEGLVAILALIPMPEVLTGFSWPDPGPLACVLSESGIPLALEIIAAAVVVRFLYSLIPLIHS